MIARVRAGVAIFGAVIMTAILAPLAYLSLLLDLRAHRVLPVVWHRVLARLFGFRIHVHGEMDRRRPLLIVSNHVSWSDILVLGSLEYVSFIAKSDMESQPFLGGIAKLQKSVFVERENRSKSRQQTLEIADRLRGGDVMVLFPEGGVSDGNVVLPFKSSLLGAAEMTARQPDCEAVFIQPVSLAYVRLHGMPMGRRYRNVAAWLGDTSMLHHFLRVLREGSIDVEVRYGEPTALTASVHRKEVTRVMETRVRELMAWSLREAGIARPVGK